MIILQIMGMRSSKFGGLEKYMLEMARFLDSRNDKLYIVYNSRPSSQEYIDALTKTNATLLIADFVNDSAIQRLRHIFKLLRGIHPDILHVHFGKFGFELFAVAKLFGVKKTYRSIRSMPFTSGKVSLFSKIRFTLLGLITNHIVCVSGAVKKQVNNAQLCCKKKTIVSYTGTNFNENAISLRKPTKVRSITIATVAFHDPVKGIDVMLGALNILKNKKNCPDFTFLQIGGGKFEASLKRQCHKLGLDEYVIWKGICDNVPELLAPCDIYVQPSRSEGIGMSLMEAAAQSLPLIGSDVGGIPEIVIDGYNGYLVKKENSEELAERLYELCINDTLRIEMGNNSLKLLKTKFVLKDNVRQLVESLY